MKRNGRCGSIDGSRRDIWRILAVLEEPASALSGGM